MRTDSVDGLPNRDLVLSQSSLAHIIGPDAVRALVGLVRDFNLQQGSAPPLQPTGIFARRYSADTFGDDQPWTSFHFDNAHTTVNVALSADHAPGGRLLGVYDGAVRVIERAEGDATVHSSSLLHGVSRMCEGVRHSLIMFYTRGLNPED